MRVSSKATCTIGVLIALALTASAAEARRADAHPLDDTRFAGAHASVATPSAPSTLTQPGGGISYGADIAPFPTGHGGNSSSPDFQMMK